MSMSVASEEQHVLVLIAMEAEAAPLLAHLGLEKKDSKIPGHDTQMYSGSYKGMKISICTNGKCTKNSVDNVGTTPAAISTFVALTELSPTIVINAGTAGGFKAKGACIGDTFVSEMFRHHDRRITIPGWDDYARGHHESHSCANLVQVSD